MGLNKAPNCCSMSFSFFSSFDVKSLYYESLPATAAVFYSFSSDTLSCHFRISKLFRHCFIPLLFWAFFWFFHSQFPLDHYIQVHRVRSPHHAFTLLDALHFHQTSGLRIFRHLLDLIDFSSMPVPYQPAKPPVNIHQRFFVKASISLFSE